MTDIDTLEQTMDKLRAINKAFRDRVAMEKLDADGRHRSEWAYAPYDGRYTLPKTDGQDYEISSQDETKKYYTPE